MLPHTDTDSDAHSQTHRRTHPSTHTHTHVHLQCSTCRCITRAHTCSLTVNTRMHAATFPDAGVQSRQRYTQTEQGRAARRPTTWGGEAVNATLQQHVCVNTNSLHWLKYILILFFFFKSWIILNPKPGNCNFRSHCFHQGLLYLNSYLLAAVGCTLIQDGMS